MKKIFTLFLMLCLACIAGAVNYLTFTAEEENSSFAIECYGDKYPDIQFSQDGGETWSKLEDSDVVTLQKIGDKALLKGENPEGLTQIVPDGGEFNILPSIFIMEGKIAASGSIMSLVDGTGDSKEIPHDFCFFDLFDGCSSLTQAPELPATILTEACYDDMFYGCTSLAQAPKLPATILTGSCYYGMFFGCTGLTQAPKLPATKLAEGCYFGMFSGCTSLTQAPELPATTLAEACYYAMFDGCTNLTQAPELPATTLVEACYCGMFSGCTNLTQAPELPATTLAEGCYNAMFDGCTNLTQAPELIASKLADYCYGGMFHGCTNLTQAPELIATKLADYCYNSMFSGCTNLSEIKVSFDDWKGSANETIDWVRDVASSGTFICPKTLTEEYGASRIPEGWTVKYIEGESGVRETINDAIDVWTEGLTIFVSGTTDAILVHDLAGKLVTKAQGNNNLVKINVPQRGTYIVSIGLVNRKVEL